MQRILAVREVPAVLVEGEVEEGLVKVKVAVAMAVLAVGLGVIRLSVSVVGGALLLAG